MIRPRRRTFYVDPLVQYGLALRVVVHWLWFLGIVSSVAVLLEYLAGGRYEIVYLVLGQKRFFFYLLAAAIPAAVSDAIRLSNQFAGPMVRVRRSMRALAEGYDVKPLRLRSDDMWRELSDDFNLLLMYVNYLKDKQLVDPAENANSLETNLLEPPQDDEVVSAGYH